MIKHTNILVTNDEDALNTFNRIFEGQSYKIIIAQNVQEAYKIIEQEKVKVVIADQAMSDPGGIVFLRELKLKYPSIVRVLLAGESESDVVSAIEAINLGEIYRFIVKPWNESELKATFRQALEYYELVVENQNLIKSTKTKIEDLEVANRKIKEMFDAQRGFSSTVSHELRTPLASIKMAIDIVMSGTAGPLTADQRNFLNKAKANIDRLKRLIDEILDLSKLEAGKIEFNMQSGDINKLIKEIAETQEPVARNEGLYLKTNLMQDLPALSFDSDKITQVLSNLINNAIKFTEEGGITISSVNNASDKNHVEISICDTGMGIAERDLPKLFDKFQQLGDPAKRKTGGTGLGLSICYEIIKHHGGKVWMESKLGKGSCAHFIIPIEERRKRS